MRPVGVTDQGGYTNAYQSRVPTALQTVFLTSNRGIDVHVPPPKRLVHSTILRRGWLGRKRASPLDGSKAGAPASCRGSLVLISSKDNVLKGVQNVGVPSMVRTNVQSVAGFRSTPSPISLTICRNDIYSTGSCRERGEELYESRQAEGRLFALET
jgi:hypothetical protein